MGWYCSYTPLEIIYAAGFQPFRVDGHSEPIRTADSYIHANMCQFIRSAIDIAIEGGYDQLEGAIFVNSCDAMRRLHDVWKQFIPSKFIYILDLPMGKSTIGPKYLKNEFQKLKIALENYNKSPIKENALEEAINIFTESRSLFHDLNNLRLNNPTHICGKDIMKIIHDFFKSDPIDWNNDIKSLLKNQFNKPPENNEPRILLSGSPIHDVEFIGFIEECGLKVIYEDLCTGSKFFDIKIIKSEDLLDSLSNAYLNRTPCARMMNIEERAKKIIEFSKKFGIEGIIHHSLKFCDVYLYDVPKLKEFLVEEGFLVLFLESDGTLGGLNQLKTRIEAFSEMIRNLR